MYVYIHSSIYAFQKTCPTSCTYHFLIVFVYVLSTRRHPAHPVSVPILCPTELNLWSQKHETEILSINTCHAVSGVDNAMTREQRKYLESMYPGTYYYHSYHTNKWSYSPVTADVFQLFILEKHKCARGPGISTYPRKHPHQL